MEAGCISSPSACLAWSDFFEPLNLVEFKLFWWVLSPVLLVVDFYHLVIPSLLCWGRGHIAPVMSIKATSMYEASVIPRLCFKKPNNLQNLSSFFPLQNHQTVNKKGFPFCAAHTLQWQEWHVWTWKHQPVF